MINPIGNPSIIPSILSSKPPCPGNILPVSFIFDFLLRYENNKSPVWTKKEIIIPINRLSKIELLNKIFNKKKLVAEANKNEPTLPEKVLLGLILVSLGPLNVFPKM